MLCLPSTLVSFGAKDHASHPQAGPPRSSSASGPRALGPCSTKGFARALLHMVRGGGAGRADVTRGLPRWPQGDCAEQIADLGSRTSDPALATRRRHVRPRAQLEPVLHSLRLPVHLLHRGAPLHKRARPASLQQRAPGLRRLGRFVASRFIAGRAPGGYVLAGSGSRWWQTGVRASPKGRRASGGTEFGHRHRGVHLSGLCRQMPPPLCVLSPGREGSAPGGRPTTLTLFWRPGSKEAPPAPGPRGGSSREEGARPRRRRAELVPVVSAICLEGALSELSCQREGLICAGSDRE